MEKALFEGIPRDGLIVAPHPLVFSGLLFVGHAKFHLYPQLDTHLAIRVLLEAACVHLGTTDRAEHCSRDSVDQTVRLCGRMSFG